MNPQKRSRRRGVILTLQGLNKLENAKSEAESYENSDKRYTLEALSIRTGLDSDTLMKVFAREVGVDKRTLNRCYRAFNLKLEPVDYRLREPKLNQPESRTGIQNRTDWGTAPDVPVFYGRAAELTTLKRWILEEGCRLVTIVGIVGIGKTHLSVTLTQQIQNEFEFVIWRSLRNAPPIKHLLAEIIQFLSQQQEIAATEALPLLDTIDCQISRLMEYLRSHRCLLLLDNGESIIQSSDAAGAYREGYEGYGQLFRCIAESCHQSCLILTTRQKPKWLASHQDEMLPVRSLKLTGLSATELQQFFQSQGCCCESPAKWSQLIDYYAGNPLLLKHVSETIQKLFGGCTCKFLIHNIGLFGKTCVLLQQQIQQLSEVEKEVINWLAIHQEPASFSQLCDRLFPPIPPPKILEALESLEDRSLLEKNGELFSVQPLVRECITHLFLEDKITPVSLKMFARDREEAIP